ncbi:hemerythrin domain-containing protein [Gilvimarinus xylanilyticus]|uniref:Hemerythrin domain-containing protein n=1 Tax=Gilvimarinus xylanilyticus TaxID=2944139 RepID=A0A9X2KTT6_9GAMM|nr:hemerythrin domain-containing protein [Gilvimarinus xylanilyticus]MCP8899532.1 hemerythrin domain-containing protein [Gilvimarinus xylanilyticus]
MSIFDALREDHDVQRKLLDDLISTEGKSREREQFLGLIKEAMESHAAAEERYFYKPLIDFDTTIDHSRHSVAEHHELEELLEALTDTDMDSSAWMVKAKNLKERLLHHLDEEETEVFPLAGKALTPELKNQLGSDYIAEMSKRSHFA